MTRYPEHPAVAPFFQLKNSVYLSRAGSPVGSTQQRAENLLVQVTQFLQENQGRWPSPVAQADAERLLYRRLYYFMNAYPEEPAVQTLQILRQTAKENNRLNNQLHREVPPEEINQIAQELRVFREEHNGAYPSARSRDRAEHRLYKKLRHLQKKYPEDPLVRTFFVSPGSVN